MGDSHGIGPDLIGEFVGKKGKREAEVSYLPNTLWKKGKGALDPLLGEVVLSRGLM